MENRHGENHLLREGGTGRNSVTQNYIFFCNFSMFITRPFKKFRNMANLQSLDDKSP